MPYFTVRLKEIVFHEVTVEAETEGDAPAAAEEAFVQGDGVVFLWVDDRYDINTRPATDEEVKALGRPKTTGVPA